jgi:hypothetical protein
LITFESNSKLHRIGAFAFAFAFAESCLTTIQVLSSVEMLCTFCSWFCQFLTSITFDSHTQLQQIEASAFAESDLIVIQVLASVEMLCTSYFSNCKSLISITFESNSKLPKVVTDSFAWSTCLRPIEYLPSLVEQSRTFVSPDACTSDSPIADEEQSFGYN